MSELSNFASHLNKKLGQDIVKLGVDWKNSYRRFSSGALTLDIALGGGWPFSKICLVVGAESTGKTFMTYKAIESVQNYDRKTKFHKSIVPKEDFSPCRSLFVTYEGFDPTWASKLGVDLKHFSVASPDTAEQGIDIITEAIKSREFDLIILDCISAMSPDAEQEAPADKDQMGVKARLLNKGFRKWEAQLAQYDQQEIVGPSLICLNHFTVSIGVMYGDNRSIPGGTGQLQRSSIIVYTKSLSYRDKEGKEIKTKIGDLAAANFSGAMKKNKTSIPKQAYEFTGYLKDAPDFPTGSIDNNQDIFKLAQEYQIIDKNAIQYRDVPYATQKAFKEALNNKVLQKQIWDEILHRALK